MQAEIKSKFLVACIINSSKNYITKIVSWKKSIDQLYHLFYLIQNTIYFYF